MPDPYKNEEIETRTLSLCLFDVAGVTVLNRCSNCPGAARAALHHQRCPRDPLQPNVFHSVDSESKILADLKSSASSSKVHERETDTQLWDGIAALSLGNGNSSGTGRAFGRSKSDPFIRSNSTETSVPPQVPHVDVGVKRKLEADPEAHYKKKMPSLEFDHHSAKLRLMAKPQKPFRDLEPGNLFNMPGCRRVPSDDMLHLTSLVKRSEASPMDTQEDHPSGKASSSEGIFVAGCIIGTVGCGVLGCKDGLETKGSAVFTLIDEMDYEEP